MFKNRDLMILVVVFGIVLGSSNTIGTIISEISDALNYDKIYGSLFGALFILGWYIGCGVFGAVVEKYQCFKIAVITSCLFSTIFLAADYFVIPKVVGWAVCILSFGLGGFMFPIVVVAMDFGVELTYPIGESMSTGVLMSSGQIFGIIFTVICSKLLDNDKDTGDKDHPGSKNSLLILVAACGTATVLALFVRQNLRRQQLEKQRNELRERQE